MSNRVRFADQMQAVLSGRSAYDDLPDYLKSAIQFELYKLASGVLSLPTKEERRARLASMPEAIRPHVEQWALRLHTARRAVTK